MGSWTYSGAEMSLEIEDTTNPFDLDTYVSNGEWRVISATAVRIIKKYDCCPEPYHRVSFTLHMKRQSMYYFFNLIVPMILIGMKMITISN